jgi:hypothetical protein
MALPNYASKTIVNSLTNISSMRDEYIRRNGFDVILYKTYVPNSTLTEFGEPSYYAVREEKVIKFLPAFKTQYSLLSFNQPGVVNEQDFKKIFHGFIQTNEEVNKGDYIKISYIYDQDITDVKYYQIKKVAVSSIIRPYSKKIFLQPYVLPINLSESSCEPDNYEGITPLNTFI